MAIHRSTGLLSAVLVCGAWTSACGGDDPAYPAELEGHHEVTGRTFCEYTIDGNTEIFLEDATIRVWPPTTDNVDCDGDFYVETPPNPAGGSCARIVSDGATLVADLSFYRHPDFSGFETAFYSSDPGVGTWSLEIGRAHV